MAHSTAFDGLSTVARSSSCNFQNTKIQILVTKLSIVIVVVSTTKFAVPFFFFLNKDTQLG